MSPEPIRFPTVRIEAGTATITCVCGASLYLTDLTEEIQCESCGQTWQIHARIWPVRRREGDPPAEDE